MAEIIYQSTSIDVTFQAYLSSDHVSPATGKTIAITISKNKGAYGNPSAGATNATEIASGSYYVNLSTTDTATLGPLLVLGTAATVDPVNVHYRVRLATNGDMTAFPNTAVTTNASLLTSGTGTDQITVSGGIASADAKKINAVSTSSVTTVSANQGTTQPINFTGTGGSALAKSDMVDIAGAAVSASTAQIGVNIVNIGGSASTGAAGYVGIDWGQITNKTTTNALTGTTISSTQTPPTVAAIATAVWQDTTAGDFNVASSIGKSLFTSGVVPGGAGGLLIAGSNAATTFATMTSTGAFTINGTSNVAQTGDSFARIGAAGIGLTAVTLGGTQTFNNTGTWTGSLTGSVGSVTGNVGGNVTGSVGSVVGAVGSVTGSVGGNVTGSVGSVIAGVTVTTNNDKTGYALSSAGAGAIWDVTLASHLTPGSTGYALNAAGAAGDPWSTSLPGAYTAGTAGYIVGTYIPETWELHGLDAANPLTVSATQRATGTITQTISGSTTVTVTRV